MEAEREKLVAEVDHLLRCVRRMTRREPPTLSEIEQRLTMGQYRVLRILARTGEPMTVGALRAQLGVGGPSVSRMVDRLVNEGMVERRDDPADRRRALVELTPAAEAALQEIRGGHEQHGLLRQKLARLDEGTLRKLQEALQALAVLGEEAP
ncbi:MAG TPA: MarR family transcriptional regulator [Chloroflexota bacterium]|jgi:DNA-binding MarR family transcriptional regulator|nr:MarR family transcriptional regulator [Chloroflexota bacterium]